MMSVPVNTPLVVGVNVTLSVQLEFANTFPPHVLTTVKSAGFGPSLLVVYVNDALPVLEKVSVWGALVPSSATFPKANVAGDTEAKGAPLLAAKDAVLDQAEVTTPLAGAGVGGSL
jgi:hypothetical protein